MKSDYDLSCMILCLKCIAIYIYIYRQSLLQQTHRINLNQTCLSVFFFLISLHAKTILAFVSGSIFVYYIIIIIIMHEKTPKPLSIQNTRIII